MAKECVPDWSARSQSMPIKHLCENDVPHVRVWNANVRQC